MTDDARVREIALLPCPFCGGDAKIGGIRDGARVYCNGCHASGAPAFNPDHIEGAQVKWNTRAIAALPPQPVMTENGLNANDRQYIAAVRHNLANESDTAKNLLSVIDRFPAQPVHQSSTSIKLADPTPEQQAYLDKISKSAEYDPTTVVGGPRPSARDAALEEVQQHVGWLKITASTISIDNWRDAQDALWRQLEALSAAIRAMKGAPTSGEPS